MEEQKSQNNPWSFENFKKRLELKKKQNDQNINSKNNNNNNNNNNNSQNNNYKKNNQNKKKSFFKKKKSNNFDKNYVQYNDDKELESRNKNKFVDIYNKVESHYQDHLTEENTCPICQKIITNFYDSHKHKETGKLAHLTCLINEIKKKEELRPKESICYMGNSTFVICTLPDNNARFFIRKKIQYMENKSIFNKNKANKEDE